MHAATPEQTQIGARQQVFNRDKLSFQFTPINDPTHARVIWRQIESEKPRGFFLSWHWVGAWLKWLGDSINPYMFIAWEGTKPVAAAILVRHEDMKYNLINIRQWWVHETGIEEWDSLTLEDNGFLVRSDLDYDPLPQCLGWLLDYLSQTDEILIRRCDAAIGRPLLNVAKSKGWTNSDSNFSLRHFVYLSELRESTAGSCTVEACALQHLEKLGRNTRAAIRRSLRTYEEYGPVHIETAQTQEQAHDFLSALKALHQETWTARGKSGSFAKRGFERFHRHLIDESFSAGVIELCRISAGPRAIGYLYNFRYGGWVHNYQSGLAYGESQHCKPGLVWHHMAIANAAHSGAIAYDFMAGDVRYKRNLGTHTRQFCDTVLCSKTFRAGLMRLNDRLQKN